jgi:hypothetical protein
MGNPKAAKTLVLLFAVFLVSFFLLTAVPARADSPYATTLVSYSSDLTGSSLYNDPYAALGQPSTNFKNSGFSPATGRVKLVEPAWNVGLSNEKLITSLNRVGDYITVKFDHQVTDDPNNPYGIDFLVFGNSFYVGSGFVNDNSDMSTYRLVGGAFYEPMKVSVSQDGVNWYTYNSGPYCDSAFPTQAYLWDAVNHAWTNTLSDFTKPVNPTLKSLLETGNMSAADAIALYDGSGGGTGFDLAESGLSWIQYIKVEATSGFAAGEVDAFADVAPVPIPGALWLLGTGLAGLAAFRKRNTALRG